MQPTIDIRHASAADFLAIAALDRLAWRNNRQSTFIPDGEHVWRIWVEHALVFVAVEERQIIGAVLAFPCLSGAFCLHKEFVDPSRRGAGLGSRLFEAILREIDRRGADCFLTVDPVNEAALRLYAAWGFTERTFIPGFYRPGEDRNLLWRRRPKR